MTNRPAAPRAEANGTVLEGQKRALGLAVHGRSLSRALDVESAFLDLREQKERSERRVSEQLAHKSVE